MKRYIKQLLAMLSVLIILPCAAFAETLDTLIIDGSKLTSTATSTATDITYTSNQSSNFTITFSSGAKLQTVQSTAENNISSNAILIGKSGAYIYNKTAFPGKITKFEVYANKGASAKVSIGVKFSDTYISSYATGSNTYTQTLSTVDKVYDCSSYLTSNTKYFWYQVTNTNNSQIQIRIIYEKDGGSTPEPTVLPVKRDTTNLATVCDTVDGRAAGTYILVTDTTITSTDTTIHYTKQIVEECLAPEPPTPSGGCTYTLHTGAIEEGDYIVVYSGKALKASLTSSRLNYEEVETTGNKVVTNNDSIIWHISAYDASYWNLYNNITEKYAASTGAKNVAALSNSESDNKSLWTISGTSTYEFVNKQNKTNGVNANLRANGEYGFACYSTSTGGSLTLYKGSCNPSMKSDKCNLLVSTKNNIVLSDTIKVSYKNYTLDGTHHLTTLSHSSWLNVNILSDTTYQIAFTPTNYGVYDGWCYLQMDTLVDSVKVLSKSLPARFAVVAQDTTGKYFALRSDITQNTTPKGVEVTVNTGKIVSLPSYAVYSYQNVDSIYSKFLNPSNKPLTGFAGKSNTNLKIANAVDDTLNLWSVTCLDTFQHYYIKHISTANRQLMYNMASGVFGNYAQSNATNKQYVSNLMILPFDTTCNRVDITSCVTKDITSTSATIHWIVKDESIVEKYILTCGDITDTIAKSYTSKTLTGLSVNTTYNYTLTPIATGNDCSVSVTGAFTTKLCDDVPTNVTATAKVDKVKVSWSNTSTNTTVKVLNSDLTENQTINTTSKSLTIDSLEPTKTYYIVVLSEGTCASDTVSVTTEADYIHVAEWFTDSIRVNIGSSEAVAIELEKEVTNTTKKRNTANDLFFSKYYEAKSQLKLLAIYNGTGQDIDLSNTYIRMSKGSSWDATSSKPGGTNCLDLSPLGTIPDNTEYILYTFKQTSASGTSEGPSVVCVNDELGWDHSNWFPTCKEASTGASSLTGKTIECIFAGAGTNASNGISLDFAGDKTIVLARDTTGSGDWKFIDMIGAGDEISANSKATKTYTSTITVNIYGKDTTATLNDDPGWYCSDGVDYETGDSIPLSTNRYLLIRNNEVTDGYNAVKQNTSDFVTLCTEWLGRPVGKFSDADEDNQTTCQNFVYVADFDYNGYYSRFDSVSTTDLSTKGINEDGTYTLPVPDLDTLSCKKIKMISYDASKNIMATKEVKVPIMIDRSCTTLDSLFYSRSNTQMDANDWTLEKSKKVCKDCDVVILRNGELTKVAHTGNEIDTINNLTIYPGGKLTIGNPSSTGKYMMNSFTFRRDNDSVPFVDIYGNSDDANPAVIFKSGMPKINVEFRVTASRGYWITLPDTGLVDDAYYTFGDDVVYGDNWALYTYDGERRAKGTAYQYGNWIPANIDTLKPGVGYLLYVDAEESSYKREIDFPVNAYHENIDKTVDIYAYGAGDTTVTPNHKGWNLIGCPYFNKYKGSIVPGDYHGISTYYYIAPHNMVDSFYNDNQRYIVYYDVNDKNQPYKQSHIMDWNFPASMSYFIQAGNDSVENGSKGQLEFETEGRGVMSKIRKDRTELIEQVVSVDIFNDKNEKDETSFVIGDYVFNEYPMIKQTSPKGSQPIFYSVCDFGNMFFQAIHTSQLKKTYPVTYYAYNNGTYTISVRRHNRDLANVQAVFLYDYKEGTVTNLLYNDYEFESNSGLIEGRLRIGIVMKQEQNVTTDINICHNDVVIAVVDGKLNVSNVNNECKLFIYDMSGKMIINETINNYSAEYDLLQGFYNVAIINNDNKIIQKIFIK